MLKVLKVPPIVILADRRNINVSTLSKEFKISDREPVFNRNGFYKSGKEVWIEYNGQVILTSSKIFSEHLYQISTKEKFLTSKKFKILEEFINNFPELASKQSKKVFQGEKFARDAILLSRQTKLTLNKLRKNK